MSLASDIILLAPSCHSLQMLIRRLEKCCSLFDYGRTLSDASMLYFADVFYLFFMRALVGETAERIFTKLSHVVDIRCYLRMY